MVNKRKCLEVYIVRFDATVCRADSKDCSRCFQLCSGGSVTDLVKSHIKDGGGHLPELVLAYVIKETLNVSIKDLSINVIAKQQNN